MIWVDKEAAERAQGALVSDVWRISLARCAVALLFLTGCASEGPLKPPSLHLPGEVRGLKAQRVGDAVDLQWTSPVRTTDGLPLTGKNGSGALVAEICRQDTPGAVCAPAGKIATESGASGSFRDPLPPNLTSGPGRLLSYRVRVLNGRGRGAAYDTVESLAGGAPMPVRSLQAMPVTGGVELHWQPEAVAAGERTLLRVTRGNPQTDAGASPHTLLLAVEPSSGKGGGALDVGARPGVAQTYIVTRTRTVTVGGNQVVISSVPATVSVSALAKAPPPAAPSGLEAVANTLGAPEIDLVWQPSAGADGYRIYRAEGGGATMLLTPEPLRSLTYTDKRVRAGVAYRYSMEAVDAQGLTGQRSAEVQERIPQP